MNPPPYISHKNNMGAVRYYLALSVLIAHFNILTGHEVPWPTSSYTAVGGFFALSGFLVFGSFMRHPSLKDYLSRRARRILPPYFLIVVICALAFCSISSEPVGNYFFSGKFFGYLAANLSFLNFLQPELPGVFEGAEYYNHAVNGSLWTMKVEWMLYLSVPIIFLIYSKLRINRLYLFAVTVALSIGYRITFLYLYSKTGNEIYELLGKQVFGQLSYFYVGVIIFFIFDQFMRYRWWILSFDILAIIFSSHIPYYGIILSPIVTGTLVLLISMSGDIGYRISRHDNVSYDIYLFHYPIIQLCVYLGFKDSPAWITLPAIIAVTWTLASLSWNLAGKRFKHT